MTNINVRKRVVANESLVMDVKAKPDYFAPDGSHCYELCRAQSGNMAYFEQPAGAISKAVTQNGISELWMILSGVGLMWMKQENGDESITFMHPKRSISIPDRCTFQFWNFSNQVLTFVLATMPPWPGDSAAIKAEGIWPAKESEEKCQSGLLDVLSSKRAIQSQLKHIISNSKQSLFTAEQIEHKIAQLHEVIYKP